MKTAVTVLQEMMVKLGQTPEYECISQVGPQHLSSFEYQCKACGATVTATARSKKEGKQEAARLMLRRLAALGHSVPPPFGLGAPASAPFTAKTSAIGAGAGTSESGGGGGGDVRSYVALLKELCDEYRLPAVEYSLVGDTGPPHLRHFTVRARIGSHARLATATTKKAARQHAAEQLYTYLRENLALTKDFVEEEALVRAHEKAMERYLETRDSPWRPDLGQKVSEYHLGLAAQFDEEARKLAAEALESRRSASAEDALAAAVGALGLGAEYTRLGALSVVQLAPCTPALAFAGAQRADAAGAALRYLRLSLLERPPSPHSPLRG